MGAENIKRKIRALNNATVSFRQTKQKTISRICAPAAKHKWLMYPLLIVAFFYILFANIAFYTVLWVLLNRKRAVVVGLAIATAVVLFVLGNAWNDRGRSISDSEGLYEEKDLEVSWYDAINIDFTDLGNTNKDIVGWIYFENEDISYPILKGQTNEEYADKSYDGKKDRKGSIFLDCKNSADFDDFHTVIYGKDMPGRSMFGKLKYYHKRDNYYSGHEYFQIITSDYKYRYEIIAYKRAASDDVIFDIENANSADKVDFVTGAIVDGSMLNIPVAVSSEDHFVTLSTCAKSGKSYTVSAIRTATKTL